MHKNRTQTHKKKTSKNLQDFVDLLQEKVVSNSVNDKRLFELKDESDRNSLAQQRLIEIALNVSFSQNKKLLDELEKKNTNNNTKDSTNLYFEIAVSTQQKAKKEEEDMRQRISEFKRSTLRPPFVDEIMNYINEDNVIVASMVPYVACLTSLFVLFITSVDDSDELLCSNVSMILQSSIILLFLIPLVYFIHNQLIWKKWIDRILNRNISIDGIKEEKKDIDLDGEQQQQENQEKQHQYEWIDFDKFAQNESWYETMRSNIKEYLCSIFLYLILCCYACATILECTIGGQGTGIITFILMIFAFVYFIIGLIKQSTAGDVEKIKENITSVKNSEIENNANNRQAAYQTATELNEYIRSANASASAPIKQGDANINANISMLAGQSDSDNDVDNKDDEKKEIDSHGNHNSIQDKKVYNKDMDDDFNVGVKKSDEYVLQMEDIQSAMIAIVQDTQLMEQYFQSHQKSNERDHDSGTDSIFN